jgi:hypothetical protein
MEQSQPTQPYRAHDGQTYPRPYGASDDHVPVWHRFVDLPTGQLCEHVSHWVVDPGPIGYLSSSRPIDADGRYIGNERARCFNCGTSVMSINGTFYRRDGRVILIRCQDDPLWDAPNVAATDAVQ